MAYKAFLRLERYPTTWCPGCGIGIAVRETAKAFDELGFNKKNTVSVSGIGCSGRASGYFKLDSVHGCHGRAIPLAEGIKRVNNRLNVLVFSGDGDLLGIGGNHLLHCSRRDVDITVICIDNSTYGMTGGQMSPTTDKGIKTPTSPFGAEYEPVNTQGIITQNKRHFYARTTVYHVEHMRKCIKEALQWKGFSFVDIISDCIENYGRRIGFKSAYDMLMFYKEKFKINTSENIEKLGDNELGIVMKDSQDK